MALSPYRTALALRRPRPTHVRDGVDDSDRVTAYSTYEEIWNNVPEAFAQLLRSGDDPKSRRYIPAVRGLVEAVNRYLAQEPEFTWTPLPGVTVTDDQMAEFLARMNGLMAREELDIKLLGLKRWWLIKGDALLVLSADPAKEEGTRIRLTEVPADQYFPIYDTADGERVVGCYLASVVLDDDDAEIVQRIEYHKVLNEDMAAEFGVPLGSVFYRIGYYAPDGWDDREPDPQDLKPVEAPEWAQPDPDAEQSPLDGFALPTEITSIPVYHFRNNRRGGIAGRFGSSEIQGMESLLAGMIQNSTDEDMTIALMGIGVYWTTSGKARNSAGVEVEWELAPGTMLELEKDGKLGRVEGVGSVQPIQDHMAHLKAEARDAAAIPAIAAGQRDPNADQSGVALRIEFMPVLSKNMEKEAELSSKLTHMLFDLIYMWFPAYEGWTAPQVQPGVVFGDPLPVDRAAVLKEILDMVAARVVSIEWAQSELQSRLGYKFPASMLATIVKEQMELLDAAGARIADEAAGLPTDQ
jgi:hypothetical protein